MKSVLISIQPKWCELIASGKKTVEVRKTKPKLETPFKVYIYCTYGQGLIESNDICYPNMLLDQKVSKNAIWGNCCNGKVIGEFVCNKIIDIDFGVEEGVCFDGEFQEGFETNESGNNPTCLSLVDLENYLTKNEGYGWHISDLVIYDKPKELSEFQKPCIRDCDCAGCENAYYTRDYGFEGCALEEGLTRPPQSWCYVESEVEQNAR